MQENNKGKLLKRELKEKLDWYTMYASEEEYDEKAVESILYLLDNVDPLEKDSIPSSEEAWERFRKMQGNAKELLPLTGKEEESLKAGGAMDKTVVSAMDKTGAAASGEESLSASRAASGTMADKAGNSKQGKAADSEPDKDAACSKGRDSAPRGNKGKFIRFMLHYKAAAAVLFLVIAIAVGGSIQAGAVKNNGFFFWLNRDETGTEMITSPEGLSGVVSEAGSNVYYDRNDMPEWTQDWLKIEARFEMPENYEWQCFEIKEFVFDKNIISHYLDQKLGKNVILGVCVYDENIFYNRDGFANYNYVDSYEVEQKEMDIYCKTEETGDIFYTICFYEGNNKYYVSMQDNLDKLKIFAKQYWNCVKNYLQKL